MLPKRKKNDVWEQAGFTPYSVQGKEGQRTFEFYDEKIEPYGSPLPYSWDRMYVISRDEDKHFIEIICICSRKRVTFYSSPAAWNTFREQGFSVVIDSWSRRIIAVRPREDWMITYRPHNEGAIECQYNVPTSPDKNFNNFKAGLVFRYRGSKNDSNQ
jgi:hypothetical protein